MKQTHIRNTNLDILRIIAVISVISVHVGGVFVTSFPHGSAEFTVGNVWDGAFRFCIPLFLMISGALLLDESRPYRVSDFLKKAWNMALLYLFWSVLYAVMLPLIESKTLTPSLFWIRFTEGAYHLWYLPMMIGLYLIIPVLRLFVKKANIRYLRYLLFLGMIFALMIPFFSFLSEISSGIGKQIVLDFVNRLEKIDLGLIGFEVFYLLAGWYLFHVGISQKFMRMVLYAVGVFGVFGNLIYVYLTGNFTYPYSGKNIAVACLAAAIAVFVWRLPEIRLERLRRVIAYASKCSFGVYIIHVFVLETAKMLFPYGGTYVIGYPGFLFAVTLTISAAVSVIFSKIPFLKALIRIG